jgi:hypothetical protein
VSFVTNQISISLPLSLLSLLPLFPNPRVLPINLLTYLSNEKYHEPRQPPPRDIHRHEAHPRPQCLDHGTATDAVAEAVPERRKKVCINLY